MIAVQFSRGKEIREQGYYYETIAMSIQIGKRLGQGRNELRFELPNELRFEHGGVKLASCPGRHLTSLRTGLVQNPSRKY